jgi:hypothetical protein
MKVAASLIKKLTLTEIENLDPVHVMLEDYGPGEGRITITCYGQSWTSYWGQMSDRTISRFFRDCGNDYLGPKLSNIRQTIVDESGVLAIAKRKIFEQRRAGEIDYSEAREYYDLAINADSIMVDISGCGHLSNLFGDSWDIDWPQKENPDWAYLMRIIDAVKAGLEIYAASELSSENDSKKVIA